MFYIAFDELSEKTLIESPDSLCVFSSSLPYSVAHKTLPLPVEDIHPLAFGSGAATSCAIHGAVAPGARVEILPIYT
jgi:hypothetical protein